MLASEPEFFNNVCYGTLALAALVFALSLAGTKQPMGRYAVDFRFTVPAKVSC